MRRHYPKTSPAQLQVHLAAELNALLPWQAVGRSLGVDAVMRLLWLMACWRASLHAVMGRLGFGCCENTVRHGIFHQLPDVAGLSARLSERLVAFIGRQPRRGFHVAIDTHFSAYYGDESTAGVVRGQLKASTRKFFVYATACAVDRGRRYTLAVVAVESARPAAALEPLLSHLTTARVKLRSLALDKAFFAAEVFALLRRRAIPYVVAVPHHRRELKRFLRGRAGSTFNYRLHARSSATEVTIRLRRVRYRRAGKRRTEVYAVNRMGRMSDDALRAHYRRRFAIESSYRQLRQAKPQTTSRNAAWRLLLIGLALLFRQLWTTLEAARAAAHNPGRPPAMALTKLAWLIAQALTETQRQTLAKTTTSSTHPS